MHSSSDCLLALGPWASSRGPPRNSLLGPTIKKSTKDPENPRTRGGYTALLGGDDLADEKSDIHAAARRGLQTLFRLPPLILPRWPIAIRDGIHGSLERRRTALLRISAHSGFDSVDNSYLASLLPNVTCLVGWDRGVLEIVSPSRCLTRRMGYIT